MGAGAQARYCPARARPSLTILVGKFEDTRQSLTLEALRSPEMAERFQYDVVDSASFALCALMLFMRQMLQTRHTQPWADRLLLAMIALYLITPVIYALVLPQVARMAIMFNLLTALANCVKQLSPSPLIHLVLAQNCVHCARAVDQTLQRTFEH